jgi:hypothetical protein
MLGDALLRDKLTAMSNLQDQIRALETSIRRQRLAIATLASVLAVSVLIGAVRPASDATFDKIVCREWYVVDGSGKVRIGGTAINGSAGIVWSDKNGNGRIIAATHADGTAGITWSDKGGKPRIVAGTTADGTVSYPTKSGS